MSRTGSLPVQLLDDVPPESWVTFTALWWSWSAANETATPTIASRER
jgi:hypothetical protein